MSEPRYAITHSELVNLLALTCVHGILGERDIQIAADEALEQSNEILDDIGVEDITELNEQVGLKLATLLPDDWPSVDPPPSERSGDPDWP